MQLLEVRLDRRPTLLDYLAGGGTIKLLAALDFSSCNPPDGGPGSMHHAEPDCPSACERVVTAFASSLQARPLAGFRDRGQFAGLIPVQELLDRFLSSPGRRATAVHQRPL